MFLVRNSSQHACLPITSNGPDEDLVSDFDRMAWTWKQGERGKGSRNCGSVAESQNALFVRRVSRAASVVGVPTPSLCLRNQSRIGTPRAARRLWRRMQSWLAALAPRHACAWSGARGPEPVWLKALLLRCCAKSRTKPAPGSSGAPPAPVAGLVGYSHEHDASGR